jgi:hypothetical protein
MVYDAPFGELEASVLNLHDAVMGIVLAADGAPERHSMSDLVADASVEMQSQSQAMVSAVGSVRCTPEALDRHDAVRQAVVICHEQYIAMTGVLQEDLLRYERVAELAALRRKRGGEWVRWTHEVVETLNCCRQPLYEVQKALLHCWTMVSDTRFAGSPSSYVERTDQLDAVGR